MFTKIISSLLAALMMLISSVFPGFVMPGTQTVETGAFLAQVDEAFGYTYDGSTDAVLGVQPGDEYFEAVAAAAKYDVLVDYETIDVLESVKPEFVATVLVNALDLEVENSDNVRNSASFKNIAKVSTAVAKGIIKAAVNGNVPTGAMSKEAVDAAIAAAVALRNTINPANDNGVTLAEGVKTVSDYAIDDGAVIVDGDADLEVGDVYVLAQSDESLTGAAYKVEAIEEVDGQKVVTNSNVEIEEVIEKIDYEGSSDVDFATAMVADGNGTVLSDGYLDANSISKEDVMKTLKKLANVSFSVKGFKVKAKITDTGLDFSISKGVCDGVTLSKSYSLTNLTVDAKADMNIAKLNFNEVYLNFDYDLVDTTSISGSYGKVFGNEVTSEGEKLAADTVIANAVNKYVLSSFDSTSIKLFTFTLPIGTTPLTVTFDVLLEIDVNGRMSIVVTSEEYHGVEIINNKVSTVNNSKVVDRKVDIYGDFALCLGLDVALGLYGYALVDVCVTGGVGANVTATARLVDADGNVVVDSTYTVPVDYLVELASGMDFDGKIDIGGHAEIYGVLKISVGNHSVIGKVGLKKTWTIFDQSNATFASVDF